MLVKSRHYTITLLLCLACGFTNAAKGNPLDSLEKVFQTATGAEKLNLAGELAYQFCYLNTEKALTYGNIELELALATGDSLVIAQAWNDLGAVYASRGEYETSVSYTAQALRVRQQAGDSLLTANSCNKLGYAYTDLGRYSQALNYYLRAARIYEENQKPGLLANILNNIGSIHFRQGNHDKALEYLEKARKLATEHQEKSTGISASTNIANIHFDQGKFDLAQEEYLQVLDLIAETGIQQNHGTIRMNLGSCFVYKGNYADGLASLAIADSIFRLKDDAKGMAMTEITIALARTGLREFDAAARHLQSADSLSGRVKSDYVWYLLHEGYYRLYASQGNMQQAMQELQAANLYRERIYTSKASEQIAEMQTLYETEKKDRELQTSALKNRNQFLVITGLGGLLLLLLIILLILLRNQRLRRESLVQKSVLALQEERLRISRDLHDNIGAELTLITSSAEEAAGHGGGEVLKSISNSSRNAMQQLRETIWAIQSESIAVESFVSRLTDFAARLCGPQKIVPEISTEGDTQKELSPTITLQLFRLCQEAIHNAVKYSGSPTLSILLESEPAGIRVTITDKGKGFDPSALSSGYGLANMKARAAACGGTVVVNTAPGVGTTVVLSIPA